MRANQSIEDMIQSVSCSFPWDFEDGTMRWGDNADDRSSMFHALMLWYILLTKETPSEFCLECRFVKSFFADSCRTKRLRVATLFNSLKSIEEVVKLLPEISSEVNYPKQMLTRFKRELSKRNCNMQLASAWYRPVLRFAQHGEHQQFFWMVEAATFLRRLQLTGLDTSEQNCTEYVRFEHHLNEFWYSIVTEPGEALRTIDELSCIIHEWFRGFSFDGLVPKHGPGSVAGASRSDSTLRYKYTHMESDSIIQPLCYLYDNIDGKMPLSPEGCTIRKGPKHSSEIVFVPKDTLKQRIISREPVLYQYFQQALKNALMEHIGSNRRKFHWLDLSDQDKSRELARCASIDGSLSTIDLSSASDSVSLTLVEKLFHHETFRDYLFLSRTRTTVLPDGTIVELEKFAPMGSSLCFPIECLVFGSIVEHVIRKRRKRKSFYGEYRIYGDDIIVSSDIAADVCSELVMLGFKVNHLKTYTNENSLHYFREACGIEAFDGFDVTPCRISRKLSFPTVALDVSTLSCMTEFCDRLFSYGFLSMRKYMITVLFDHYDMRGKIPFITEDQPRLGLSLVGFHDSVTNYHLSQRFRVPKRTEPDYQTRQCRCLCLRNKRKRTQLSVDDEIRYHEYWLTYLRNPNMVCYEPITVERPSLEMCWNWVNV